MTASPPPRWRRRLVIIGAIAVVDAVILASCGATVPPAAGSDSANLDLPAAAPDLVVTHVSRARVTGDWQTLDAGGMIEATVANVGDVPVGRAFDVTFFEDTDGDRLLDRSVDTVLGETTVTDLVAASTTTARAPVSGAVSFRDNLILAYADPLDVVAEANEWNNVRDTGQECVRQPVAKLDPVLEWQWTESPVLPESRQVMMMPVVIDLTADGVPEVVFSTYESGEHERDSHLRAVRGSDGSEVFTVDDPRYDVAGDASIAAGDIDVDGYPEILAVDESWERVIAFEHDGRFKWRSPRVSPRIRWGGPAIADIDTDGVPEIIVGRTVLNNDGTLRWAGTGGSGNQVNAGTLSLVADLDLDGRPDVVAGSTAYRAAGSTLWSAPAPDGFNAVGNFDGDPQSEVVLVASGSVYLLEHDGRIRWGPKKLPGSGGTPYNFGGPPTVADVDADGQPEIGVAGAYMFTVFETDGTVKWSADTEDFSSSRTGSSVFDFEGDGSAEVIYSDQERLYIYRGSDGALLWQTPSTSSTTFELPVIADVDADGHAEIVVASNYRSGRPESTNGIRVYGGAEDTWMATRRLWNQHTYHITNVNDDGTIPRVEIPSWLAHNTYRLNLPGSLMPAASSDLTASFIQFSAGAAPGTVDVRARIGNGGAVFAPVGIPVAFYDGDPAAGGSLLHVAQLARPLVPGKWIDVGFTWSGPGGRRADVHAVADDDGAGTGTVAECDETNNHHDRMIEMPTPTSTATPTATQTPTPASTPMPMPRMLYLPILLRETLVPKYKKADVVLVIDASSSMAGAKIGAAKSAARAFVEAMNLPDDRVALVSFNTGVDLEHPISGDAVALERAIDRITTARGTRIDRGLRVALDELGRLPRADDRVSAIVLFTDGRQYEEPETTQDLARRAHDDDIGLYVIGLGGNVDEAYLVRMAGTRDRYFFAPDATKLEAIYRTIAVQIPCDPVQFWGRRCR